MHSSSFTSEGPQEDEEIKCPKCLSFFSSLTKPYILPCNHNICLNCINSLIQENNTKCPVCSFKFNKKDKKKFEVNFTFLNIILKILQTKIILCTKCNKIFYWKEHYKLCEQKYFRNFENIFDEIKIDCEESAKIIKLIKENGDLLNKYKIELYNVTKSIIKEIHKKYITHMKSEIKNNLFKTKMTLDFQKIKHDMINFIKLFSSYPEHFDTNEINKIIEKNGYNNFNDNLLSYSYSDLKNKSKELTSRKNAFSPPVKNILLSDDKKYQTISNNNKNSNNINKKTNNKINKFLRDKNNNMKDIISEEKETEEEFTLPNEINNFDDEGIIGTERVKIKKNNDNNISKYKKEFLDNNNNNNNENKSTIQNEKKNLNKNIFEKMGNPKSILAMNQQTHQKKKSKFDIKSLFNDVIIDEEDTKNKIIIGLKDIKVVSLKQSVQKFNNSKFNLNLIKTKMKFPGKGKKIILANKNNLKNKNTKNNNDNDKLLKTINLETPSFNLLRSTELTKRDFHYTSNQNKKDIVKNKNNNINIITSLASTASGFNNLSYMIPTSSINHSSTKDNLSSRENTKKIYSIPQKNSPFVNNKMLKDFNKTKESSDKLKLYSDLISFLYTTINNNVDNNISLLNNIIMSNYELLLSEISFKSTHSQKNFCLSFFPNTYNILLYDPFNKKFTLKNFYQSLNNKENYIIKPFNISDSIVFDDNDLIFFTGEDILLILSFNKGNIIQNKIMPSKKAFHKSIFIKNKLYIIGGENQYKKVSNECFYFDIEKNNWNFLPNLKKARKNFSLCYYNDSLLYVFNGEDDKNVLNTIEFIDINNLNNKNGWTIFEPIDYGFVWHAMKNSLVINFDKDKILICGGEDNNNNLFKDCFLFKPSTNNVYKGMDLKVFAAFISEGCFYKDEIFGIDYKNKTTNHFSILHSFNIKNNYWNSAYINNINY